MAMRQLSRFDTSAQQSLTLRVDPRVVLAGQLLEMNSLEIRSAIEAELQENPALEWLDDGLEPPRPEEILKSVAPQELQHGSDDREFLRSRPNDAEEADWLDFAASSNTLESHLIGQMFTCVNAEDWEIAMVLIASLDDRGYLETEPEEIALDHGFDLDRVEAVLKQLQRCEPAGIGARNLHECLNLQLRNPQTLEQRLARDIVKEAFEDLVDQNIRGLMRRFRALPELVFAAIEEIQSLTPFPAEEFQREQPCNSHAKSQSASIDLVIQRTEFGWTVDLPGSSAQDLMISRAYSTRLAELESQRGGEEKRHLQTYVSRAQQFIDALKQRGQTLQRIGYYLVESQPGFVSTGDYNFLQPLTRRKVAESLGLHESSVSRATAGKHLQIANGEVVSFDVLFKPALRVQQMILEILATEDPRQRLSDERIAAMLAERGVHVARRTVNKYRDRSKTLSSRRRRTA